MTFFTLKNVDAIFDVVNDSEDDNGVNDDVGSLIEVNSSNWISNCYCNDSVFSDNWVSISEAEVGKVKF